MRRRPPPTPRQRRVIGTLAVVVAVDAVVNLLVFNSGILALVQLGLAAWLAWRIWWAPRART